MLRMDNANDSRDEHIEATTLMIIIMHCSFNGQLHMCGKWQ